MYPVDLLKTRLQVINPSPGAIYSGLTNAFTTITRIEGTQSLWRGMTSVIVGAGEDGLIRKLRRWLNIETGPAHAVYFATYEAVKQAMGGNDRNTHHPLAAATSGACATIASDALMNPFDVIKQRMQIHGSTHRTIAQCARRVYHKEGLKAFYVSYPTTLCMTVPYTALQFMAYEFVSKVMNPSRAYDPLTHCVAGGLAGGFAAGLTTPLDVIKTLLQTRGTATDARIRSAKGLWVAASIIKQQYGYGGFFRGWRPRIITAMPSTAICWSSYEMAKAYFSRHSDNLSIL
ncbi:Fe(2+) transporter [Xylographa vitiligo]|nr:Fe(2+) transporter [Xylographa vitiligo]